MEIVDGADENNCGVANQQLASQVHTELKCAAVNATVTNFAKAGMPPATAGDC